MNASSAAATPPLTLTRRVDGPWLAIPDDLPAEADSIVLVDDPRSVGFWKRIAAHAPAEAGKLGDRRLIPLAHFGVAATFYRHTRVVSVYRIGISRARNWFNEPRAWTGARVDRLKLVATAATLDAIAAAVIDTNTLGRVRS